MKTYYVDASIGNDANLGTSEALALKTIQSASQKAVAGDIVYVKSGTYKEDVTITASGNPNNWITFQAYPGDKPIIEGEFQAIHITGNYVKIIGFDITAKLYDGIFIDGKVEGNHHIQILNNTVHDAGGNGIGATKTDYLTIENNTVYRNAFTSFYQSSGISIYEAKESDKLPGFHNIIRGNTSYSNENKHPRDDGQVTDGNGIIIDDFRQTQTQNPDGSPVAAYTAQTLVENNIVFDNGGRGVHIFQSDNVVVRNNIASNNLKSDNLEGTLNGEITTFFSSNISFYNNTVSPKDSSKKAFSDAYSNGNKWDYNLSYGGIIAVGLDNSNAVFSENNLSNTNANTNRNRNIGLTLPSITLVNSTSSVAEDGSANIIYTFSRAGVASDALVVNYGVAGTADFDVDYKSLGATNFNASNGTITFAAGASTATLIIDPVADSIAESDGTIAITLANNSNYTIATPVAVTSTIINDDAVIRPVISISNSQEVVEGITNAQRVTYTVTLSSASNQTVTVQYATTDGTAKDGFDYTATQGTLTFAPGVTSQIINVAIQNDAINEANENFILSLTAPTNASLGDGIAITTITDTLFSSRTTILPTSVENLTLSGLDAIDGTGNVGNNIITGNSGNNLLSGGGGNDTINGGNGVDTLLESANVNFTIREGQLTGLGTDIFSNIEKVQLQGGIGNNTLNASALITTTAILEGGDGNDTLTGGAANDSLLGGNGDDILRGGAGNDWLDGGSGVGSDTLIGGTGVDTFVLHLKQGGDRITDFSGDILQISKTEFGGDLAIGTSRITANSTGAATNSTQRFIFDNQGGGAGQLFYDADGNGARHAVLVATLSPTALSNASIITVVA
jgi:parallel beta-helix repeat protein